MHLTMDDSSLTTVEQLSQITSGLQSVKLTFNNKQEMYTWMERKLTLFDTIRERSLGKHEVQFSDTSVS